MVEVASVTYADIIDIF